jgi:hypothetical protein
MKLCLQEKKGLSSKELLNIPISVSLLYEKEYENMIQSSKKRRSVSEKKTASYEKNKSMFVDISPIAKLV